ncbi:asparaginase domain-containing protein [Rhodococcus jostii]|uniref:Asparaginase n=1 Tax=Rhodococcus jostii TaxID=132919 RepID=A0A1H4IKC7_RHOJO|nr:asparaginase domain-containing protein [Rhodococcus jostii]SEB34315.1 Asparaginase [Rhodococcus jostii]
MTTPSDNPRATPRVRIAVFSGPTATIGNSPDLVTSNKARRRHGLDPLTTLDGATPRFDLLRPQRLAAPVTVYVEAYTAHPLEADARELYALPDGWLNARGEFQSVEPDDGGTPVYEVELRPDDGLYPLPYMARQADGSAWDATTTFPFAPPAHSRQTFYPDARRVYEEIERFGLEDHGHPINLSTRAEFDFFRPAPSGGYRNSYDDDGPESFGEDYFPYYPYHLQREPDLATLARATNLVQQVLASGDYIGAQWLEGSPTTEETLYWLALLVDTTVPIVGHTAQRRHQSASADGARNIIDGVKFLVSSAAVDESGRNRLGAVLIVDELVYSAREVTKVDARPGGYEATGGHGGIVADMGGYGPPRVTYTPTYLHTHSSDVRLSHLPTTVSGVTGEPGEIRLVEITVKDADGYLVPDAMPVVSITKYGRYGRMSTGPDEAPDTGREVEVLGRIAANLVDAPLAGFVCEGMSPFGMSSPATNSALATAVFSGMPVVRVGRGNTGGMAYRTDPIFISGSNLTSTKARMLLMAALLKLGTLPVAEDPTNPTPAERTATEQAVATYQHIFDTH